MLKRFAALIISAIFISIISCTVSPGFTYTVNIDPFFSQDDKASIITAIHSWEDITSGELNITSITYGPCNSNDNQICFVPSTESIIDEIRGTTKGDIIGFTVITYSNDNSTIYIPLDSTKGFQQSTMTTIMAHEFGHALGLQHTQPGTVMCWQVGCDAAFPTCDDYQQWRDVRGIKGGSQFQCPHGGSYTLTGK